MVENRSDEQAEPGKHQERANRILEAASELLQRWGYKKTTIDDIARQAGVAKGTIYLHWKTKEDLFMALIMREKVVALQQARQAMENEPGGITLYSMVKHSMLWALRNPLIKAIMLRDTDVLGDLIHTQLNQANLHQQLEDFNTYLLYMQQQGLIRKDIPIKTQVYMLEAIALGFLMSDRFMPDEYQISLEERAAMAAEAVRRTFEIRHPDDAEKRESSNRFNQLMNTAEEYLQKETGNERPDSSQ
ncbi:TetR/AcrR family transcriptional regulator [Dictyobacter kobayashii]|uniref:TetR family transcriptional regulator n=1 Tax=Dictyobacter kobayashii TaxID=2014872 RepID=A0A402AKG4_9CHLR|nr:TetR/AcrR family transcriptional regulator [Dictyobacter kobayashii]GCE19515.1 TetR family transcriptional regulator [Dictyobacter kobayashii]